MSEAKPPLQPAEAAAPPPPQQPSEYMVEFLVETAEGFHVLIQGQHLTPKDFPVWTRNASKALADQGFKPVRRDLVIDIPAPAAAGGSGGAAEWIKGENGAPPRCSVHGPAKWVEGTNARGKYAFWGCQTRGCKPTGSPT